MLKWILAFFFRRNLGKFTVITQGYSMLRNSSPAVRQIESKVKRILGLALIVISAPFLLITIYQFSEFGTQHIIWASFCLIFGLIFFIPGISLVLSAKRLKNFNRERINGLNDSHPQHFRRL